MIKFGRAVLTSAVSILHANFVRIIIPEHLSRKTTKKSATLLRIRVSEIVKH